MLVDYFVVRKGNLNLPDMFSLTSHGRYHYFHGFNLRAFASFVIGFLLPLPGFAGSFGHKIGVAATHMYALGWVLSFLMGCLSYYVICLIWKVPGDDGSHPFESEVASAEQVILDGLLVIDGSHAGQETDGSIDSEPAKEVHVMEKTV
jgi:NCS1 family nucleobase:cation symporter-1